MASRPGEKFSGLAIEDTRDRAKQLQDELVAEGRARAGVPSEAEIPSTSYPGDSGDAKRGREGRERDGGEERGGKRSRQRSRSRERDGDRHGDRRRDGERYRDRDGDRGGRDGDRGSDRGGRDGRRGGSPGARSNRMPPPPPVAMMPDSAEQGGVYRAVISNVMDFGAFCELQACAILGTGPISLGLMYAKCRTLAPLRAACVLECKALVVGGTRPKTSRPLKLSACEPIPPVEPRPATDDSEWLECSVKVRVAQLHPPPSLFFALYPKHLSLEPQVLFCPRAAIELRSCVFFLS